MQAVFSMSQLQYFQLSTIVELYKKNQGTQKFCPLALIFHLAPYRDRGAGGGGAGGPAPPPLFAPDAVSNRVPRPQGYQILQSY